MVEIHSAVAGKIIVNTSIVHLRKSNSDFSISNHTKNIHGWRHDSEFHDGSLTNIQKRLKKNGYMKRQ